VLDVIMQKRMKVYKTGKAAVSQAALVFVCSARSSSKRYRIGKLTVARLSSIPHLSMSITYLLSFYVHSLVFLLLIYTPLLLSYLFPSDSRTQGHVHLVIRSRCGSLTFEESALGFTKVKKASS